MKATSGTTAFSTSDANAHTLIAMPGNGFMANHLVVTNTGTTDGFVSLDGTNWVYLPKGNATVPGTVECWEAFGVNVQIKRATSDLTGVYAYAEWVELKL